MMQFLKNYWGRFVAWVSRSDLPSTVEAHEQLSRFLYSDVHFAETKAIVRYKAFLPDVRGETSVFRIDGASESEIWQIGNSIRTSAAKARGDFATAAARQTGLQVDPATEEHARHAVMTNWPSLKHERLYVATQLSSRTILRMAPSTSS